MSFTDLPAHLQQPVPGSRTPPRGFAGHIARAIAGRNRNQELRSHYASSRDAFVAAAAQNLRQLGSDRAAQLAELLEANPDGAHAAIKSMGGWEKVYQGLATAHAAGIAAGQPPPEGELPETRTARVHGQAMGEAGLPGLASALGGAATSAAASQRQTSANEAAMERAKLDAESRLGAARISASAKGGLTVAQQTKNRAIDRARVEVDALREHGGLTEEDMRRIVAKGQVMDENEAIKRALAGEVMDDEQAQELFLAAAWKLAGQPKAGDDPDFEKFRDMAIGKIIQDAPGKAKEHEAARAAEAARAVDAEVAWYYKLTGDPGY